MLRRGTSILSVLLGLVIGHEGFPSALAAASSKPTDELGSMVRSTVEPRPEPPRDRPGNVQDRPRSGNPLWAIPLSSLSATRERPIFSPSRRPPTPTPAPPVFVAAPPPPPSPVEPGHPSLTLIGTIVGDADQIGIFLDQATHGVIRLKIRQEHGGWILVAVQERQVTFEKGTRVSTLTLPTRGSEIPANQAEKPAERGETPASTMTDASLALRQCHS
jgi:hypothetical protein